MILVSIALFVAGVCLGSFVNALVWRLHEQAARTRHPEERQRAQDPMRKPVKAQSKVNGILKRVQDDDVVVRADGLGVQNDDVGVRADEVQAADLSILRGRSMCPHCRHRLAAKDLVPIASWLWLRGKCRYCRKPISAQYPLVEVATGLLFVISYWAWPYTVYGIRYTVFFALWLVLLVGFVALTVYDIKWMLLPNRIMYPLFAVAVLFAAVGVWALSPRPLALLQLCFAVLIGGGIFYLIFQLSAGKWIGGGDVKLGWLLGLVVMTPARAFLMIFLAALAGSLVSLPLLAGKIISRKAVIPFGPFLILGAFITVLWGGDILGWYQSLIGY